MTHIPDLFIQSVACCQGFDEEAFLDAHETASPTSIRLNPFKKAEPAFETDGNVKWSKHGLYLKERPNFTHDALFQAGCYYVQEAGSMFIEHVITSCVDIQQPVKALDVCAAPGGKSTLINSVLHKDSLLVANEVVKPRAEVLAQNLSKWGSCNTVVTNNDPSHFTALECVFDVMVVDAPCSGSGLFRKQPEAVDEWSMDNVNLCSQRQKRILSDVLPALAKDGVLIYSTCSYSEQENEAIADWLVTEFDLENCRIPLGNDWGVVETISKETKCYGYRFYPDKTRSEGFFCSVFRRKSGDHAASGKIRKENFSAIKPKERLVFDAWLSNAADLPIVKFKDDYLLCHPQVLDFINRYQALYYKKAGTNLGSLIHGDLVPHHELALSVYAGNEIASVNCSKEEAILFMKKELLQVPGSKGWNLVKYEGFGLGWIKNLGNRINNYLPNEYRILK